MQTSVKQDDPEKQIQFALPAYIAQLREVPERFEGDLSRGAVGSVLQLLLRASNIARYSRDGWNGTNLLLELFEWGRVLNTVCEYHLVMHLLEQNGIERVACGGLNDPVGSSNVVMEAD